MPTPSFFGGGNGDLYYTSSGVLLDDTFSFELGTFANGFTPDASNLDQWRSNWKLFDKAVAGDGWNSGAGFLSSSATLNANGTSTSSYASLGTTFSQNEQAYVWIYNNLDVHEGSEWALVTGTTPGIDSNWQMPAPSDQTTGDLQWRFDNADTRVLGGLNDIRGPGTYTNEPPAYQLQTSAIPEPSSALLLTSLALLTRRRRSKVYC